MFFRYLSVRRKAKAGLYTHVSRFMIRDFALLFFITLILNLCCETNNLMKLALMKMTFISFKI